MDDWETLAGHCLMVGLPGPRIAPETVAALREIGPGGIILFRRNLESWEGLASLMEQLDSILLGPRLVALDQEGGRVSRLESWVGPTPSPARLARAGVEAAERFGAATASALRALGFNVNFAPVVDLTPLAGEGPIGDRSFGSDPSAVGRIAGAFLEELQSGGVAGCLKHFPGLGGASLDTHVDRVCVELAAAELECRDLVPFRSLSTRTAAIMVGHACYPSLDATPDLPASLSRSIVGGWLRGRIGFEGVVATDDLEMGAVRGFDSEGEDAVLALAAGCDLLLYSSDLGRAARAKKAAARRAAQDPDFASRLASAAGAVRRLASRWIRTPPRPDAWEVARRDLVAASRIVTE